MARNTDKSVTGNNNNRGGSTRSRATADRLTDYKIKIHYLNRKIRYLKNFILPNQTYYSTTTTESEAFQSNFNVIFNLVQKIYKIDRTIKHIEIFR